MQIKFLKMSLEDARALYPHAATVVRFRDGCLIFVKKHVDNSECHML